MTASTGPNEVLFRIIVNEAEELRGGRLLSDRLTAAQHEFHHAMLSTLHVHLDHDNCLEVIVVRGPAGEVRRVADLS